MNRESIFNSQSLVLGCGNPLFGDDGFGPAVIAHLESHFTPPPDVVWLDAGTAVRDILFDVLLSEQRPRQLLIVDAYQGDEAPAGTIREIRVDQINPAKTGDFSLHQFPTTNLLREIRDATGIDLRVLVVHIAGLPAEVAPGLSTVVAAAIEPMCQKIFNLISAAKGLS
jgi:coenzyme F420 hydrogenase subunit delta